MCRIVHGSRALSTVVVAVGLLAVIGCQGILTGDNVTDNVTDNATGNSGVTGKFVGAARCKVCHTTIHAKWSDTGHSGALETLEGSSHAADSCLACHTVGYGLPGGFVDRATTNSLAGVQCENCHGPGLDHVSNVADRTLRPTISISADVCAQCHTGAHHPTVENWKEAGHSTVVDHTQGRISCGECHSGDVRYTSIIKGLTPVDDDDNGRADALEDLADEDLNAITCAICHDPHEQTGNDPAKGIAKEAGHDSQLRYPLVVFPDASNTVDNVTDPSRYNLCGQCHHSRGKVWESTSSRGPHYAHQSNIYFGEMATSEGKEPLVPSNRSIHAFVEKQCVTCHMQTEAYVSEEEPANTGHKFELNTASCAGAAGCHPTEADAKTQKTILQTWVAAGLDDLKTRMGDEATWEYKSSGGPDNQTGIPDEIKKTRFMVHYIESDGSLGVHNPQYIDSMLDEGDRLLTSIGK